MGVGCFGRFSCFPHFVFGRHFHLVADGLSALQPTRKRVTRCLWQDTVRFAALCVLHARGRSAPGRVVLSVDVLPLGTLSRGWLLDLAHDYHARIV